MDFGTTKLDEGVAYCGTFNSSSQCWSFGIYAAVSRWMIPRTCRHLDPKPELVREFCGHLMRPRDETVVL
jgi:hypothetical protein